MKAAIPIVALAACPAYGVQYLSVEQAQQECFPTATTFRPAEVALSKEQAAAVSARLERRVKAGSRLRIWRVMRGGELLGWFVLDAVIGKHLLIDYAVALSPAGKVKQVEILEYRENYGGEIRREDWRRQFVGKGPEAELALDGDIRNITGATLSCRHVTEGVKKIVAIADVCL